MSSAAVLDKEGRQVRERLVDEQGDAALGKRADLGHRECQMIGGERDGSAWKLPPDRIWPSFAKTSGLSLTAFASISRIVAAWRKRVEAGAHNLRLAADRVRVLDASRSFRGSV